MKSLSKSTANIPLLKGAFSLELKEGDMFIESDDSFFRKKHNLIFLLYVCVNGKVKFLAPTTQRKAFIKANGGKDLMHESGDVAGCVRMAVWLRRQPNLSEAFQKLLNA
jgi:hypothetical protein